MKTGYNLWRNRISGFKCTEDEMIQDFNWYLDEGGSMPFSEWVEEWEQI